MAVNLEDSDHLINLNNEMLRFFAEKYTKQQFLELFIKFLQKISGCKCVGVRVLDQEGYIPYEAYVGFSQEFWEAENFLSVRSNECACVRVITQKPKMEDAELMTTNGSFVCNKLVEYIDSLTKLQRKAFIGNCAAYGYQSFAVVPIVNQEKVIGAIHLADSKMGNLPFKLITYIERVAPVVGEVLGSDELRKKLEAPAKLKTHFDTVLSRLNEFIYIIDTTTYEIVYVNKTLEEAYGHILVGEKCYEVLAGLESPCKYCVAEKSESQYRTFQWETHNKLVNKYFKITSKFIQWPDGRRVLLNSGTDVTELKNTSLAFAHSEIKFKEIFDNANDALFFYAIENGQPGPFLEVNRVACTRMGYSYDEFHSKNIWDIAESRKHSSQLLNEIVQNGHAKKELIHRTKEGKRIPVEISSHLFVLGGKTVVLSNASDISERKAGEEAIQKSAHDALLLLDQLPSIIMRTNIEGRAIYYNKAYLRFIGQTLEQALKDGHLSSIHPDDREGLLKCLRKKFAVLGEAKVEFRMRRSDGIYRKLLGVFAPFYDTNGDFRGYIGSGKDVTDERQAKEKDIILYNATLMVINEEPIETIANYICKELEKIYDLDLVVIGVYEPTSFVKFRAVAGKAAAFAQGLTIRMRPDAVGGLTSKAILSGEAQKGKFNQTKEIFRTRAEEFNLKSYAVFPMVFAGKTVGVLIVGSTDESISEYLFEQLKGFSGQVAIAVQSLVNRNRVRLLITALQSAADSVMIIRSDGNIRWVNPTFLALTGYRQDEIVDKDLAEFCPVLASEQSEIFRILSQGQKWYGAVGNSKKDGTPIYMDVTMAPVYTEQGPVDYFILVGSDVTEHKKFEQSLLLAKERALRAERLAALGTMVAGVTHEINQPLNALKVTADSMLYFTKRNKHLNMDKVEQSLQNIVTQADRITKIINHMRSFVRIEKETKLQPCNLNEVVSSVLGMMGSQLEAQGISLEKDFTEIPPVLVGQLQMEEVVINLLNNAMQSLDKTVGRTKQIICRTYGDISKVYLEIIDNGIGIDSDVRNQIFDPFFTTKPVGEGMGLGLSIVYSIVKSRHGDIEVLPNELGGATFKLQFSKFKV